MDTSPALDPNSRESASVAEVVTSQDTSLPSGTDQYTNPQISSSDNAGELQDLGVNFVDQNVLERELMAKV